MAISGSGHAGRPRTSLDISCAERENVMDSLVQGVFHQLAHNLRCLYPHNPEQVRFLYGLEVPNKYTDDLPLTRYPSVFTSISMLDDDEQEYLKRVLKATPCAGILLPFQFIGMHIMRDYNQLKQEMRGTEAIDENRLFFALWEICSLDFFEKLLVQYGVKDTSPFCRPSIEEIQMALQTILNQLQRLPGESEAKNNLARDLRILTKILQSPDQARILCNFRLDAYAEGQQYPSCIGDLIPLIEFAQLLLQVIHKKDAKGSSLHSSFLVFEKSLKDILKGARELQKYFEHPEKRIKALNAICRAYCASCMGEPTRQWRCLVRQAQERNLSLGEAKILSDKVTFNMLFLDVLHGVITCVERNYGHPFEVLLARCELALTHLTLFQELHPESQEPYEYLYPELNQLFARSRQIQLLGMNDDRCKRVWSKYEEATSDRIDIDDLRARILTSSIEEEPLERSVSPSVLEEEFGEVRFQTPTGDMLEESEEEVRFQTPTGEDAPEWIEEEKEPEEAVFSRIPQRVSVLGDILQWDNRKEFNKSLRGIHKDLVAFIQSLPVEARTLELQNEIRDRFFKIFSQSIYESLFLRDIDTLTKQEKTSIREIFSNELLDLLAFELPDIEDNSSSEEDTLSFDMDELTLSSDKIEHSLAAAATPLRSLKHRSIPKGPDRKIHRVHRQEVGAQPAQAEADNVDVTEDLNALKEARRWRHIQAILKRLGFAEARTTGSHAIFRASTGGQVVVPKHDELKPGTRQSIARQAAAAL